MIQNWKDFTFLETMKRYHIYSTDAPIQFSEILGLQLLGHAMGYEPIHLIQPKAVHHNAFSVFIGKSTVTRKDTSQQLGQDIYPYDRCLPHETSPEQFIVDMAEQSERFQWLGEFTSLLKGVASSGYMARFVEVYNDLHGCPKRFLRKLRKKKGEENIFLIENAYISINSTVTPEMLKQHLTEEIVEGGFLARFLLVYGKPKPRPRGRLHRDVLRLNETLRRILKAVVRMDKENTNFIFSDDALGRYQAIEKEVYKKYDRILPFVGRYMNYVVSFADILLVSDAIGESFAKGISPYTHKQLKQLIQLKSLIQLDKVNKRVWEKYSRESVSNLYNTINLSNQSNYLIVGREYVDKAWKIIQPCLDYTLTLVDYVELDKPIARLMDYLRRVRKSSHSRAMQYAKLNAKQMELAVQTLIQSARIKVEYKEVHREGRGIKKATFYKWIEQRPQIKTSESES